MTKTEQFIAALQQIPQEVYRDFMKVAKVVSLQYPSSFGIDCFARGEGIEYGFLEEISKYINLRANSKGQANDPDYVFDGNIFPDAKTQCSGMKPQKTGKKLFYTKQWDIQKKAKGTSSFQSKSDCYVLIDPHYARIAVVDSAVFYGKKVTPNTARLSFSVAPEDVTMIYDGATTVCDVEIEHDSNAIYRKIWEEASAQVK
jgi:hypothetical protein